MLIYVFENPNNPEGTPRVFVVAPSVDAAKSRMSCLYGIDPPPLHHQFNTEVSLSIMLENPEMIEHWVEG